MIDLHIHTKYSDGDKSVEEIRELIGADSVTFLSVEGTLEAIARKGYGEGCGQCMACFTGEYPTEIYPDTQLPHEKELAR